MASDYSAIKTENKRRYGTDIDRVGKMLLVDRYDNRAHFIFELLQNAEDALARRGQWKGPRSVAFTLSNTGLRVSHFGAPFTEVDVRGICGIAESTKDLTAIGRFGIGFKSVYAFTRRPEIHSDTEHFSVESYVWPTAIKPSDAQADETVFILPFEDNDAGALAEIAAGLQRLGPRALLFLRQIEEISWSVKGGTSGRYIRRKPEDVGEHAQRIVVRQERDAQDVVEETWLVFSREVYEGGRAVGFVQVAFNLAKDGENKPLSVQAVDNSALVVFFPTVVSTHLGFLVQGPYRTTPSRDNVQSDDPRNQHLVKETATLLVEALHSLRDLDLLDADALSTMPLKFEEGQMFSPLFDAVREALSSKPLLPRYGGGHVAGKNAKLARSNELRDLLGPRQLTTLFQETQGAHRLRWLSEDITQDRTPELREYLTSQLNIEEIRPEDIPSRLTEPFLEAQSDAWILRLYEFLNGQPALLRDGWLSAIPLIRLEDRNHVAPKKGDQPQAFLPGPTSTDFPTVRRNVCQSRSARAFLESLGLTVADPVDDVIRNVLPKYAEGGTVDAEDYDAYIRRILTAFGTDSKEQREKLLAALRETYFVMAIDAGDGSTYVSKPGDLYLATQHLKELFEGVSEILLVDDAYSCLRGEDVRELLETCGATRYLQSVPVGNRFSQQDLADMRTRAGAAKKRGGDTVEDFTLRGFDQLLATLADLDPVHAAKKTTLLWDALCDVADRRGTSGFFGTYTWSYIQGYSCNFDAAFVQRLNETAWVPDRKGTLQVPKFAVFEETGWKENAFLLSKICFKPPIIEALAREAGIEPGVLDLLKRLNLTSEAGLKTRLGIGEEPQQPADKPGRETVADAVKHLLGNAPEPTPPILDPAGPESTGGGGGGRGAPGPSADGGSREGGGSDTAGSGSGRDSGRASGVGGYRGAPGTSGTRPFVSYLGTHPDENEQDPDGLDHQTRLALEEKAISLILAHEPGLQRTPTNNPGFDLVAADESGAQVKWVEVKAMTSTMQDRPVGLSRPQFETAQKHGPAYWLYIVENAGSPDQARIVRIQDPSGRARTFTFDHGWLSIAEPDGSTGQTTEGR